MRLRRVALAGALLSWVRLSILRNNTRADRSYTDEIIMSHPINNEFRYATEVFDRLRQCGTSSVGVTRETYGPGETRAHALIRAYADDLDLPFYEDAALNSWIGSPKGRPVVIGSHLDSVPQGGNFDGAAGVVAGLIVAARMKGRGVQVVALRGEESAWFGECYLGSKALLEGWSPSTMARTSRGSFGKNLGSIGDLSKPLRRANTIRAFLELHIEQGPVLQDKGIPLGVVTGIRGNVRCAVACYGNSGHSGTTPMASRRDAVVATAFLISQWDKECWLLAEVDDRAVDLVATTGVLHTDPLLESVSTIASEVKFSTEWRSLHRRTLKSRLTEFRKHLVAATKEHLCDFTIESTTWTEPATMDKRIQRILAAAVVDNRRAGDPKEAFMMPSGAGHDAAVFAKHGIPTGMLFVRNQCGSHNPSEAMRMDDFMNGVDVMHRAAEMIARAK